MAEQDRIQLLSIFPKEVWQLILEVADCTTFQLLRHSFPFFAPLSIPLRSQALFSAVANSLFNFISKSTTSPNTVITNLILCRQVCRAWKRGVDSFLENPKTHFQLLPNDIQGNYPKQHSEYFVNKFCKAVDAQNFHRKFIASHGKSQPFLSRSVYIYLGDMRNDLGFPREMSQVLERWGHHIWFAYVRIFFHVLPDAYLLLQRFLEYMPNLKLLHVTVLNAGDIVDANHGFDNIPPFRHFAKLQCVKTYDLPAFVWDKFRETNSHVAQVNVVTPEEVRRLREAPWRQRFNAGNHRNAVIQNNN